MQLLTVREAREKRDWSLDELAERSGVDASTISRIENGKVDPKYSTLKALAKALGRRPCSFRIEVQAEVQS